MSRQRRGRPVNGILLLDKPLGISSNRALQRAKGIFRAQKAGHTGSLDVLATGLLPICFGEATKFSAYLLDADKRYLTRCQLGVTTTSGDAEGEILQQRPIPVIDEKSLSRLESDFTGPIEQIPPMYSALKHKGQPLYKLARKGKTIERKSRLIEIYQLQLQKFGDDCLELNTHCSKGTYIRTLVEDIGEKLGCGAFVTRLRREAAGQFDLKDALTLEQLEVLRDQGDKHLDGILLPVDTLLLHLTALTMTEDMVFSLTRGQCVYSKEAPSDGLVRLYDPQEQFLGIGEINADGLIKPKRMSSTADL